MRLYLIRHPQPMVAPGICYGSADVGVAADELARAASLLAARVPGGMPLYSSPLQRCAKLAHALARQLGTGPVRLDPRLAEMHFGEWERRAWTDIPAKEVNAWVDNLVHYQPGAGESVLQVAQRVVGFYDSLVQSNCQEAIVVCHAGTIRLLSQYQKDKPVVDIALMAAQTPHKIDYSELILLDC